MFEAKLVDGSILKRIVEAIKDVVNDVNIDVSPSGKSLNYHTSKVEAQTRHRRSEESSGLISISDFG